MSFFVDRKKILCYASIVYLLILNMHNLFFEPNHISILKVACMSMAPLLFVLEGMVVSKVLFLGGGYWLYCLFSALLHGNMRFSTIGYSGLFVAAFIVFYTAIHQGVLDFWLFKRFLKYLIVVYAVCLILQQLFLLVGIGHFPLINLIGNSYMRLGKLPSLSLEPSHTAVILTFAYLCYLRCIELEQNVKPTIKEMFSGESKWVSIAFLWVMLTMGSGSAYLGVFVLAFYFIRRNNVIIACGCVVLVFALAPLLGNKQLNRAVNVLSALTTADSQQIVEADGSGASRIVPLLNTFTKLDLMDSKSWFGHGSFAKDDQYFQAWKDLASADYNVIPIVRQFGLVGWILSVMIVFSCSIRRIFSFEALLWFTLGMATLGNVYFHWGIVMLMAVVRYFQEQTGLLCKSK